MQNFHTIVSLEALNENNWAAVRGVQLAPDQVDNVAGAEHTLLQVAEENDWVMLAVRITDSTTGPEGRVVGFSAMVPDETKPGVLWTHRLVIDKDQQNRGLGTAVRAIISDAARRDGFRETRSGICAGNERMHNLNAKFNAARGRALDGIAEGIVDEGEQLCVVDLSRVDLAGVLQDLETRKGIRIVPLDHLPKPGIVSIPTFMAL